MIILFHPPVLRSFVSDVLKCPYFMSVYGIVFIHTAQDLVCSILFFPSATPIRCMLDFLTLYPKYQLLPYFLPFSVPDMHYGLFPQIYLPIHPLFSCI